MSSETTSSETYVPTSRGLDPYLGVYSTAALVVYFQLMLRADYRPGRRHGTIEVSLSSNKGLEEREQLSTLGVLPSLPEKLGLSRQTCRRCLKELSEGHTIGILSKTRQPAPPFIEIMKVRGKRRGKVFVVRILKAKLNAKQFNPSPRARTRGRTRGRDTLETPKDYREEVAQGIAGLIDQVAGALESPEAKKGRVKPVSYTHLTLPTTPYV